MLINFIKSTYENIKERVRNPFVESNKTPFAGAYLIALIIYNWKLIFTFFNFDNNDGRLDKITIISDYLKAEPWYCRVGTPILFAFAAIFVFYIFNNISLGITTFFNRWFKATVLYFTDRSKTVPRDELYDNKNVLQQLRRRHEELKDRFSNSQSEIDTLKGYISNYTSEISLLKGSVNGLNDDLIKSKNEIIGLQNDIEQKAKDQLAFRIFKATYGTEEKNIDVTKYLIEKMKTDNNLKFEVSNNFFGKDPVINEIKRLSLLYLYQGKFMEVSAIENSIIEFKDNQFVINDNNISLGKYHIIENRKKLSSIFSGGLKLTYSDNLKIQGEEYVNIDEEGFYYANSKKVFRIENIIISKDAIQFSKVNMQGKVHSNEFLMQSKNLIHGNDSSGLKIEYRRI